MKTITKIGKKCKLAVLALMVLFMAKHGQAQLESYLQQADSNTNYYTIRSQMFNYLDSLKNVMDSATFYSGAGEFKNFMKFDKKWAPRLYPDGKFHSYFEKEANFYNNTARDSSYYTDEPWKELGPVRDAPGTSNGEKGIGPMEFISIFDTGTIQSTQHLLAGSLPGGLYYSDNGGGNWVSGGTDKWARSGVGSAVFHPTDENTWYASSSGNGNRGRSSWIGMVGGIYRTYNKGLNWEQIADQASLSTGYYSVIYKIAIDPDDANILYVVTDKGILKTSNLNETEAEDVEWENILQGRFFDLEIKPGNSNVLYATGSTEIIGAMNWKIFISSDKGQNWSPMVHQPDANLTNGFDVTKQAITIEVSKAESKLNYLYCHIKDFGNCGLYYYDFAGGSNWHTIGNFWEGWNFGDGHGFGVDQVNGEYVMVSKLTTMRRYELSGVSLDLSPVHVDVEDIVYHPYQQHTTYIATHGGVEKVSKIGTPLVIVPLYEGLGVGQVEEMSTSFTNPGYIIAGFDHDGTKLTDGDYVPDWTTDWKVVLWGDGMQPLIDHKDPNNMWASLQWGTWSLSKDSYETNGIDLPNPTSPGPGASWGSYGILHKHNPSVFYRNNFDLQLQYEEVYRGTDRGEATGENDYISNFGNLLNANNAEIFVRGFANSYTNPNKLLARVILRNSEGSSYKLIQNNAALASPQQAINAWEILTIPDSREIADVAYHPDNDNMVYLLYSSSTNVWANYAQNQVYLIDYTNPSSPITTDITKSNFPNGKAGKLAIQSGALGEIFVATDFGVYYTNNELTEWQRVGTALPNVSITGLEINLINNTLRAGTYGRGVWEMPLPCDSVHTTDIIINTNTTWNAPTKLDRNLRIAPGATLTIGPNAYVAMPYKSHIKIEQGAHLIVDGGIITNACGPYWGGIQVWGNSSGSQFALPDELNPQGKLTLKNGAVIENAFNAVTLWKPNDWNSMGGIVQATNATFRNNKRAVEFLSYQNFNPVNPLILYGNVSYFRNCTFEVNDGYMISSDFDSHITMWDVDGIKFTANTFSNNMTEAAARGNGIFTIDANFRVVPGCSQPMLPCPEPYIEPNVFSDLDAAIYATNSRTSKTIFVDQAEFIGNGYGVMINAVNNATVIRSNFEVGTYGKQGFVCSGTFGTGIDITNSNGYIIEENNFTSRSDPSTTDVIGIRVNYDQFLEVFPNEIYKNNFNALNRANLAEGKNFLTDDDSRGLLYQCNTNSENYFDFYFVGQGVAGKQGSALRASGNTFTFIDGTLVPPRHINNLADNHVSWYHTNVTNEVPVHISSNVTPFPVSYAHGCPSSFGGGSNEIDPKGLTDEQQQYFEQELTESHAAYAGVENLYESLLDGGNTEAVQADISMAWPDDMWELRAELLGLSPLLSKVVLVSASDRTDVLPESIIFEVLAANPDELKKKELMEHLENKDNPLPEYMIEILESLTGNVTYKTILQGQMAYHGGMENRAAGVLLRDKLNDSIRDEAAIRSFMATRQSLPMDLQIVDSYLESGETTDALALAAMLPQLYDLTGDALAEHGRFMELKQLQAGLHDQGRNIFQLTPAEKAQLEGLVAESTGLAGMQARNTLAFVYGNDYCDCPAEVEAGLKAKPVVTPPLHKLHEPQIEARPNPASSWVSFDYQLAGKAETALLEITDTQGRQIHRIELSNKLGQYVWDTRHISPGIYYYTLKTAQASKTGKLVIER